MTTMISYSHKDWDRVEPVTVFLESNGISIWLDRHKIRPRMHIRGELLKRPREVDAFVPFLSENYVASENCRLELFLARSFDRPIFPVMLEECWDLLDTQEETKYIAGIFAARLGAMKLVGLPVTPDQILARLLRAIQSRLSKSTAPDHNAFVSYPNGAAEFATQIHRALRDNQDQAVGGNYGLRGR